MKYYAMLIIVSGFIGASGAHAFPWNFDMWLQPSIQPYEEPIAYPELSVSTTGLRIEPLPREHYEVMTANPAPATAESLKNGEQIFNTYCFVCHGKEGKGDGPVIKRVLSDEPYYPAVVARTNGYIYAYIRYGGRSMPSYSESITPGGADVVNYVRKLQGNPNTAPAKPRNGNTAEETAQ
jgi:mono/diheme cytochrome c family protein